MFIKSAKAVITRVVRSTKHPDTHYLDITTTEGDIFNCSTKLLSPDQAQGLHLLPVKLEGEIRIGKYDDRVTFDLTAATFSPLGASAPSSSK